MCKVDSGTGLNNKNVKPSINIAIHGHVTECRNEMISLSLLSDVGVHGNSGLTLTKHQCSIRVHSCLYSWHASIRLCQSTRAKSTQFLLSPGPLLGQSTHETASHHGNDASSNKQGRRDANHQGYKQ